MEKPLYPSYNMRITQGYNIGTHINSYAIDDAGIDSGISKLRAPFTGIIKKIYPTANEIWLESIDKVEYPDGTIDYLTMLFAHANDISDLFVGKEITQGEEFYSEGTKGDTSGNHCHIECGRGRFTDVGWYENAGEFYSINNGKKPEECLWIDDQVNILNDNNYNFKKITIYQPEEPTIQDNEKIPVDEPESLPEEPPIPVQPTIPKEGKVEPKLIFTCPKTDLYGIYLKENQNLYLD